MIVLRTTCSNICFIDRRLFPYPGHCTLCLTCGDYFIKYMPIITNHPFLMPFIWHCGQTSRPLHKRISEHERYTRPAYSHATDLQQSSALAQHAHASGHQIDFSSATILAKLQHQQQLDLVEHAAITILEPSIAIMQHHPSIHNGIPFYNP